MLLNNQIRNSSSTYEIRDINFDRDHRILPNIATNFFATKGKNSSLQVISIIFQAINETETVSRTFDNSCNNKKKQSRNCENGIDILCNIDTCGGYLPLAHICINSYVIQIVMDSIFKAMNDEVPKKVFSCFHIHFLRILLILIKLYLKRIDIFWTVNYDSLDCDSKKLLLCYRKIVGRLIPFNEPPEVLISGSNLSHGYWKQSKKTSEDFNSHRWYMIFCYWRCWSISLVRCVLLIRKKT
ncbi:Long-chain-fatty-acid--CoA ligase [Dirofilaria immitis]